MNVLITGITGFIGSQLEKHLSAHGLKVFGTVRRCPGTDNHFQCRLGQSMKDVLTKTKPEAIVHCAHDLSHSPKNSNIELIQRWFSDAADFGIVNQVYLSSISAIPNASSKYGREKHAIEHLAIGHGMTVFRPGLVVGNGGVFGNLMNLARKHAIIPMIDSGHTCTQWIDIMELCQAIHQMVISRPTVTHRKSTYEMHHGEQVSLKKMVQLIRGVDNI